MNILTFDLEEWYIYELYPKGGRNYYGPVIENYLKQILEVLEANKIRATFFCLGIIARNDPKIIKSIAEKGHQIGCHSDKHVVLRQHNPASFSKETKIAKDSLEQLIGEKVTAYRAPAFSITEKSRWAFEVLSELGFKEDCSIFPANRSFGGFPSYKNNEPSVIETPSGSIKEFPVSFKEFMGQRLMFSGGGYFRLIPYPLIKQMMKGSPYNMAYFHIRDLDSKQKKVISSRYFFSYYGIKGAFAKFEKFINDFNFISVDQAVEKVNWEKARSIVL